MTTFVNLDTIHRAATGTVAPASWGDQVNDNFTILSQHIGLWGVNPARVGSAPSVSIPNFYMQAASFVITPSAGAFSLSWPTAFPGGVIAVFGYGSSSSAAAQWMFTTVTTSGGSGTCWTNTGAAGPSSAVRVDCMVIGF